MKYILKRKQGNHSEVKKLHSVNKFSIGVFLVSGKLINVRLAVETMRAKVQL